MYLPKKSSVFGEVAKYSIVEMWSSFPYWEIDVGIKCHFICSALSPAFLVLCICLHHDCFSFMSLLSGNPVTISSLPHLTQPGYLLAPLLSIRYFCFAINGPWLASCIISLFIFCCLLIPSLFLEAALLALCANCIVLVLAQGQ